MRFLNEDPWERLALIREKAPNILTQMLLRGANGVGYANYPDNVVRFFVGRAARGGMDLFRIFDCLNWIDNMRVAIDAVVKRENSPRARSATPAIFSTLRAPSIRSDIMSILPRSWSAAAAISSALRTWRGY